MNQVPNMISTKDLAYLEDIFNWNFNASKKAHSDSEKINIEKVKSIAIKASTMHKNHCEQIIQILGGMNE